jgi:L-alanine-DL-glutamate epimerase-like enolase superfamily enzyme
MQIMAVEATALSIDLRDRAVTLGVGTAIKKDTVVVKVRTEDGIVGYGEAHHALAPTVVADLVNSSLAPLVVGEDALAVEHLWEKLYVAQGRTHGPGWAIWKAISGIDTPSGTPAARRWGCRSGGCWAASGASCGPTRAE